MATGIIADVRSIPQWRHMLLLVGVLVGLVLGAPGGAWALTYTFTTIDVPDSLRGSTYVHGINNAGQIVGVFTDIRGQQHGFVKTGDTFTIFDVPDTFGDVPYDINVGGEIIGVFQEILNNTLRLHGFLSTGGTLTTLDVPGSIDTSAFGINDTGEIVGVFQYSTGGLHGFLYAGGIFTTIDPPGSTTALAYRMNNAGQIVGGFGVGQGHAHGFLYTEGIFTTIDVPGETQTEAHGINDTGQIVGWFATTPGGVYTGSGGFVYKEGSFTTIDVPRSSLTNPQDINNAGQIVGYFYDADGVHGFLATPGPTPFTTFSATLELKLAPRIDDAFDLKATVTLGEGSTGIDPLTDAVTLTLTGGKGGVTMALPPGCFITNKRGDFTCNGTFGGIEVDAKITILGSKQYAVTVAGQHADLSGITNPVTVTLTIGDDSGTTPVTATWPGQDRRAATTP